MSSRENPPFDLTPPRAGDPQAQLGFPPRRPPEALAASGGSGALSPPVSPRTPSPPGGGGPLSRIYTVTEAVSRARDLLETQLGEIWLEGEIESFKRHATSGHCYFDLKDAKGKVSAVMWKGVASTLRTPLRDGMKIQARGRFTIYEGQGRFQIVVSEVRLSGEGELAQRFEELKARLAREGLFDPARKRPLPRFPLVIGVATSASGAALFDILRVAKGRGRLRFLIAHCAVQGTEAPPQIVEAISRLAPHVDVLIVGRGGGSLADLWAFNDERVARAIYTCPVPVVSAVGHEVDYTIADFVADVRAATPSNAAEICVPDFASLEDEQADLEERLLRAGRRMISDARQRLDSEQSKSQRTIARYLVLFRKRLAEHDARLQLQHPRARLRGDRSQLDDLARRLQRLLPERTLVPRRTALLALQQRLFRLGPERVLAPRAQELGALSAKLDALSPLKVLGRGFALVRTPAGAVIQDATQAAVGDPLAITLAKGQLTVRVESLHPSATPLPNARPK